MRATLAFNGLTNETIICKKKLVKKINLQVNARNVANKEYVKHRKQEFFTENFHTNYF